MAIFTTVRIICLVIASSMLTYTTSPTMLTDAMERLFSPLKVIKINVHSIAMMMTIALRFIPTLIDEVDKIMSAQKGERCRYRERRNYQARKSTCSHIHTLIYKFVQKGI